VSWRRGRRRRRRRQGLTLVHFSPQPESFSSLKRTKTIHASLKTCSRPAKKCSSQAKKCSRQAGNQTSVSPCQEVNRLKEWTESEQARTAELRAEKAAADLEAEAGPTDIACHVIYFFTKFHRAPRRLIW
jgi:hypothetical protein